jgi:acetoin utilization protein AcuB
MTRNPITVPPDTAARDALKTMLDGGFRHLPVMDGERIIGVVSMRDLSGLESET